MNKVQRVHIFGVPICCIKLAEARDAILKILAAPRGSKCKMIFTPNPEIVMMAQKDAALMQSLKAAEYVLPDGIGVVWASRYFGSRIEERVAGYDTVMALFESGQKFSAYFLGGKPGVAEAAAGQMMKIYPSVSVVGWRDGYFPEEQSEEVIQSINSLKPDILLVGLGAPKQEKWIDHHQAQIQAKAAIGIGGCFDVMAGVVQRAPVFFQKMGLEWFYRLLKEPKRAKRMLILPVFVLKVIFNRGAQTGEKN